jgi:hypothetical protein
MRSWASLFCNHLDIISISGLRPDMSLEFEYRRLAAACLDLAKRAAGLADKTRLVAVAEAWLDLADRVTRNGAEGRLGEGRLGEGQLGDTAEHVWVAGAPGGDNAANGSATNGSAANGSAANGSAPDGPQSGTADGASPARN